MRISDWSSDVCSSDLAVAVREGWPRGRVRVPRDQELFVQRRPLRTGGCPHSAAVAFTAAGGEALMLYAQVHLTLPAWVHDAVDATRTCATDEEKVALAVELSRRNLEAGTGGPFGAVVFNEIGRAHVCTPVTNATPVCRL